MASINSAISTLPTIINADTQSSLVIEALLGRLESSLKRTRDSLEKALKACIDVNDVLVELAKNQLYKKSAARSLEDNRVEFAELSVYVTHLKMHQRAINQDWTDPEDGIRPADNLVATGEEIRSRVWQVILVQRRKSRRVARMQKLYRKEKDLITGILQVRGELQKREDDRKAHDAWRAARGRVILAATGAKRRKV